LCVEPLQPELTGAPVEAPAAATDAGVIAEGEVLIAPPASVTPDDRHALPDIIVGVELAVRPRRHQLVRVVQVVPRGTGALLVTLDQLDRSAQGVENRVRSHAAGLDRVLNDARRYRPLAVLDPLGAVGVGLTGDWPDQLLNAL